MKKIIESIIGSIAFLFILAGCYNDKGNYDYISESELMSVEITAIDSTSTKANDVLTITPKLTNDDTSRYKYYWYTIDQNYPYSRDTLSTKHDLSVTCNLAVGKYTLYYQVKDSVKNIYKSVNAPLTVTATDINSGWYVLKAVNNTTDVDYFPLGKTGKARTNLLTDVLKISALQGTPVACAYVPAAYNQEVTNPDGTTKMLYQQSALHIVSNQSMVTLNASDMSVFKTLSEEFYELPSTINFQNLQTDGMGDQLLVNDNHIHTLTASAGIGKFGYQLSGGYKFCPDLVCDSYEQFMYDQSTMSLYTMSPFSPTPTECTTFDGSNTCFSDSTFQMVHFYARTSISSYSPKAYAICKNKTNGLSYIASMGFFSNYIYPDPTFYAIGSDSGLLTSNVISVPMGPSVFYFGTANKLMLHKVTTGVESMLKTFDAGETITYITNIQGAESSGTAFNDLVVITVTTSDTYKVYRFPLVGSAGEINATSSAVMSGSGKASYIMFRGN